MRVAIIPAKGISKRIQRKNIKNFCGKPLISYPLLELKKTDIFNRYGGLVTITCSKDEPTEAELQCTHNIFNILIKNKRKITGRGGPPA